MPRGFGLKNNLTKDTLIKIATIGAITLVAATSPYFLHRLVKEYFKEDGVFARKRAKKLREAQKRKLLEFKELGNGSVRITLSHLGKKLVRQYKLEDMKLVRPKRWDGFWRVLIYDIPTYQKKASHAFSKKLRDMGLFQLQKSIWVFPYDCIAEIEFLCSVFEIDMNECVFCFKTPEIPQVSQIRKYFNL